jgi:nicotinamidase-related amidase
MPTENLTRKNCALLIIDVQEKVFAHVDRGMDVFKNIQKAVQGFKALHIPTIVTEQYPEGLGATISSLQMVLGKDYQPKTKSTFSCMDDPALNNYLMSFPVQQWVLVGIEAHICVLQTAKALVRAGKQVVVLNDAISSRSIFDFSTSIAEMRDEGVRISSVETVLFELLRDSHAPEFKAISDLIKTRCSCC